MYGVKHPELVEHIDYLAVHMLPYWEGIKLDEAVNYIEQRIAEQKSYFQISRL